MFVKKILILLLFTAFFASSTFAEHKPAWNIETLMQQLASVEESRSKFTEVKHDPLLKRPLYMQGILKYQAPDYIRKETHKPYYNQFAIQGNKLIVAREGSKTRTIKIQKHPALWAFVEAFRATLSGNLKKLQRFYDVHFSGSERRWQLKLNPLNRVMKKKVKVIRITGGQDKIKTIEIIGVEGDRSSMTIVAQ